MTLRISPYSRKENQAVVALLALAEEEHRGGKSLEARARIEDLRNRFPWRTGDLAAADKLEESWNQEATRALGDLLSGVEDLKTSPSPVIHEALGARAAKMLSRFRGSPLEEKFEGVASEIARLLPRPGTDDEVANPELYLKQARDHLNHDRRGFSRLFLYLARGLNPDAESLKELQHLEGLLDERRKQGAERGGL